MVRLATSGQRISEVFAEREAGQFLDRAAACGTDDRRKSGRVNPEFRVAIMIDVPRFPLQWLVLPQLLLRGGEVSPYLGSEERQVQSAEDSVPVRIIALRTSDRATRRGRIATLATQFRQCEHLLVHPVRLRILHQEVAPMRSANQRAIGVEASLAQFLLEVEKPKGSVHGQRPSFHLAVARR